MSNVMTCSWKLVASDKFVLGMPAERCGERATIRVIRPQRKTDLFLCECHLNEFIDAWGLHYNVEVLCPEPVMWKPTENCIDVDCKKCIQDDPKTWRHK